jgi:hypothetical protein
MACLSFLYLRELFAIVVHICDMIRSFYRVCLNLIEGNNLNEFTLLIRYNNILQIITKSSIINFQLN